MIDQIVIILQYKEPIFGIFRTGKSRRFIWVRLDIRCLLLYDKLRYDKLREHLFCQNASDGKVFYYLFLDRSAVLEHLLAHVCIGRCSPCCA